MLITHQSAISTPPPAPQPPSATSDRQLSYLKLTCLLNGYDDYVKKPSGSNIDLMMKPKSTIKVNEKPLKKTSTIVDVVREESLPKEFAPVVVENSLTKTALDDGTTNEPESKSIIVPLPLPLPQTTSDDLLVLEACKPLTPPLTPPPQHKPDPSTDAPTQTTATEPTSTQSTPETNLVQVSQFI